MACPPYHGKVLLSKALTKASGDAKAEIWTDNADFLSKAEKLQTAAKALQAAAQTADQAKIKAAFMDFRGNCKACHGKIQSRLKATNRTAHWAVLIATA
ncbi:MAG: cytochrome c [Rheinheimera sp.]|nr:cytochrome c [Rheinheimera sp.]